MSLFGNKYRNFKEVIGSAPGPLPWYLPKVKLEVLGKPTELTWAEAADGNTALQLQKDSPIAVFGRYCYIRQLPSQQLIVWYEEKNTAIRFHVIDIDKLQPLEDIAGAIKYMKSEGKKVLVHDGEIASATIPTNFEEGMHNFEFPDALKEIGELIVLSNSSTSTDKMNLCLMIVHPMQNTLEIISQQWLNEGDYDFGYQWVTRVARDPVTKRIFGEGTRLGYFVLNKNNKTIEKWLLKDLFHFPSK